MSPDRFARHGPLRVSPDRTHLTHADGTPFFFLADTAWNGALLATDEDWSTYLDDRAAKGFTAIQFVTHAPWTATLTDRDGRTAFPEGRPNPIFFDRIERRIEAINARGLLAVPVLAWAANFGSSWSIGHQLSADQLIPLIRYQLDRFSRHQVLYILAGDGVYNLFRAPKWKRVARAVFTDTNDRALVTLHPAGGSWPYNTFRDEPWLDLYGYQSSHTEHPSTLVWLQSGPPATFWRKHPRPSINLEPVYEAIAPAGEPFDHHAVRRATYWSLLNAPTAGVSYGAHGVWSWNESAHEPLNHPGTGIAQPWHVALNLPGSHDIARLAQFFTNIPWQTLRPDLALLAFQYPTPTRHIAASRSDDNTTIVIYTPTPTTFRLNLPTTPTNPRWFNPRTGEHLDARTYTTPADGDWIWYTAP
jgi:hypothetical protein